MTSTVSISLRTVWSDTTTVVHIHLTQRTMDLRERKIQADCGEGDSRRHQPGPTAINSAVPEELATRLPWLSTAPLGTPVVPLV